jgi:hypothetical protein
MRFSRITGETMAAPYIQLCYILNRMRNCITLCFVSNDLLYDVALVWKIQQELTDYLKERYPFIQEMEYFTDGCAAQYKNCKSFLNHCYHKKDYELPAKQSYFATSDGWCRW